MTKAELGKELAAGKTLDSLLLLCPGQECWIYKAKIFTPGDQIIYVPDVELNEIPPHKVLKSQDVINEVVSNCYTGDDFLALVADDTEKAAELFDFVDWQHPSSALPEMEQIWEEDIDEPEKPVLHAFFASKGYNERFDPIVVLAQDEKEALQRAKRHFGVSSNWRVRIEKLTPTEADNRIFVSK